jgi:hypothetical protein
LSRTPRHFHAHRQVGNHETASLWRAPGCCGTSVSSHCPPHSYRTFLRVPLILLPLRLPASEPQPAAAPARRPRQAHKRSRAHKNRRAHKRHRTDKSRQTHKRSRTHNERANAEQASIRSSDHWSHSLGWGGVWGWDEYAEAVRGFPKLSLLPEHASTHDLLTWSLLTPLVPTLLFMKNHGSRFEP